MARYSYTDQDLIRAKINLLTLARDKYLGPNAGQKGFVCHALFEAYKEITSGISLGDERSLGVNYKAYQALMKHIDKALQGSLSLESWYFLTYQRELSLNERFEYRIQWINWMISCLQVSLI